MHLRLENYAAPVAPLLLVSDDDGALRALEFADHEPRMLRMLAAHYGDVELRHGAAPAAIVRALDAYFAGAFAALDAIRTATGGTPFQRTVWRALRAIPAGTTKSYGELAREIGCPTASRAVGAANGANPVSIVVPCHRVIGASGKLTGYGGGLNRKRWLLAFEQGAAEASRKNRRVMTSAR